MSKENSMVKKKSWEEFRDTGLFWWINMLLHTFGWAIVYDVDTKEVYPARVKYRGFECNLNDKGYIKVSKYLKDNSEELYKEAKS